MLDRLRLQLLFDLRIPRASAGGVCQLWVCILENNISAIQQELFPLCVMLYPRLKVRWELVRQLIHLLGVEVRSYLEPAQAQQYALYYQALWSMFSPEVFPDSES
ncbi:hypothetical protein [Phormidesmis priestleyi]